MTRRPFVLVASAAAVAALAAAPAQGYVLGAADGAATSAPTAQALGAKTYRVVMDSTVPRDAYADRIEAFRARGMKPQIVVDGTGTSVRGKTGQNWQTINYAARAFRRWPDAYSVGVFNEPDMSGISACQYAKSFRRAYKTLKRIGVPRVLFGEWSPKAPREWTAAAVNCLPEDTRADGWAWHGYDPGSLWFGIGHAREIKLFLRSWRHDLHTRFGRTLPVYCTEYGVMTRGPAAYGEEDAAAAWRRALQTASRYRFEQIVAWGISEAAPNSKWDTSLVDADGRPRAAFATIANR